MAREQTGRPLPVPVIWAGLAVILLSPVLIAAASPLQEWRDAAYITGGMAGVIALSLLVLQPLLAAGYLPGLRLPAARKLHRLSGALLAVCIALHVGGLYISSPMDALDALLLVSPTPFSIYGVTAMWAVILTICIVTFRRRIRPGLWRIVHNGLALIIVVSTVIHAVMIDGAMGEWSKWLMCGLAIGATAFAIVHLRLIRKIRRQSR